MTSDNQSVKIGIRIFTETAGGLSWEGGVEVSGPPNPEMMSDVIALGDQLVAEAFRQQEREQTDSNGHRLEAADIIVPSRPKRTRRTKAQIEADLRDELDPVFDTPRTRPDNPIPTNEKLETNALAAQDFAQNDELERRTEELMDHAAAQADELEGMAEAFSQNPADFINEVIRQTAYAALAEQLETQGDENENQTDDSDDDLPF